MSAFIVSKETMDHVVTMVMREKFYKNAGPRTFAGMPIWSSDSRTMLGRMFFAINLDAVTQRYPEDTKESAPGPCDISDIHEAYEFVEQQISQAQGLKSMHCLLYQCSEGDVPETSELYKALDKLSDELTKQMATDTPEYDAAVWDA